MGRNGWAFAWCLLLCLGGLGRRRQSYARAKGQQGWIMREGGGGCPWGRRAFASVPAIVAGLSMIPSSAPAQTELPPIDVIAPTPLAGSRIAKPKSTPSVQRARTVRAPGAPSQTAAAPVPGAAPSTTATSSGDPTGIDRDKVPSNTAVLSSPAFSHDYTTNFLDAVNRGLPGVSLGDQTGNAFQRDLDYRGFK